MRVWKRNEANQKVVSLLYSLQESDDLLINALETTPEADLTLEYVKGKLRDEYNFRKELQAGEDTLKKQNNFQGK